MNVRDRAWLRAGLGALATFIVAALMHGVIRIPNPGVFYILTVTCCGFLGGRAAIVGALPITFVSILLRYSDPGHPFTYTDTDRLTRMIVVLSSLPVSAVLVAILKSQADRNIAAREASFRSLVEAMPYGVMVQQDEQWQFANPAAARLFGAPRVEDLLNRSIWELLDPKHHKRIPERASIIDAGGRTGLEDRTLMRFDGSRVEAESALELVQLNGRPARLMVLRDMSHRRAMEKQIREQLADLELVNEVSRALLFGMGTREIAEYLCGIVCDRLELRAAWVTRVLPDLLLACSVCKGDEPAPLPTDARADAGPTAMAVRTVKPVVIDDVMNDPRGQPWREHAARHGYRAAAAIPLLSAEQVIGVLSLYADQPLPRDHISLLQSLANLAAIALAEAQASEDLKRRAAELEQSVQELRRSRSTLEFALRAGQMGTFDWDLQNNAITWSEGHARLFGMALEEFDGRYESFAARVHPEDVADLEREVKRARENRSVYDFEYRVVWPDQSVHWMAGRGEFSYDAAGNAAKMTGVVMDITPRRLAEARAQRQQHQIAHLLRLNLLSELASGLAHEINQPLSAISNFAGAALQMRQTQSLTDQRTVEILTDIHEQAQRAGAIVKNLRAFIKNRQPERTPSDINKVVTESLALLNAELERNRVKTQLALCETLPPLCIDPVQIQQVLINLFQNAMDSMEEAPADRRRITVSTIGSMAQVIVRVSDTGKGIADADLPRLFDSFFSTKSEGLGMGLNISRSIIESHGGSLTATNNPDLGACFEFVLPAQGEPG